MRKSGFTLVEIMISIGILAMLALSLGIAMLMARKLSEAAVYQGIALSTATNYMEQLVNMNYQNLVNACANPNANPLPTYLNSGTSFPLTNGQSSTQTLNIALGPTGSTYKTMKVVLKPTLTNLITVGAAGDTDAIEILLTYSWDAPDSKTPHQRALRVVRANIPTYY